MGDASVRGFFGSHDQTDSDFLIREMQLLVIILKQVSKLQPFPLLSNAVELVSISRLCGLPWIYAADFVIGDVAGPKTRHFIYTRLLTLSILLAKVFLEHLAHGIARELIDKIHVPRSLEAR